MYDPNYPIEEFHDTERDWDSCSMWTPDELALAAAEVAEERLATTPDPMEAEF